MKSTEKEIFTILYDYIIDNLNPEFKKEDLKDDLNFRTELNIDSLDILDLIILIEEKYNICIMDSETEKAITIKDFIQLVDKYVYGDQNG